MPFENFNEDNGNGMEHMFDPIIKPRALTAEGLKGLLEPSNAPINNDLKLPLPGTLREAMGEHEPESFAIPLMLTVYGVRISRYLARKAKAKWAKAQQAVDAYLGKKANLDKWVKDHGLDEWAQGSKLNAPEPFSNYADIDSLPKMSDFAEEWNKESDKRQEMEALVETLRELTKSYKEMSPGPRSLTSENASFLGELNSKGIDAQALNTLASLPTDKLNQIREGVEKKLPEIPRTNLGISPSNGHPSSSFERNTGLTDLGSIYDSQRLGSLESEPGSKNGS